MTRNWGIRTVCGAVPVEGGSGRRKGRKQIMATIRIKGMTCPHCAMAVTKVLSGIEGIRDVHVDLQKGEASFTEEKLADRALIRERIVKAGFDIAD